MQTPKLLFGFRSWLLLFQFFYKSMFHNQEVSLLWKFPYLPLDNCVCVCPSLSLLIDCCLTSILLYIRINFSYEYIVLCTKLIFLSQLLMFSSNTPWINEPIRWISRNIHISKFFTFQLKDLYSCIWPTREISKLNIYAPNTRLPL